MVSARGCKRMTCTLSGTSGARLQAQAPLQPDREPVAIAVAHRKLHFDPLLRRDPHQLFPKGDPRAKPLAQVALQNDPVPRGH